MSDGKPDDVEQNDPPQPVTRRGLFAPFVRAAMNPYTATASTGLGIIATYLNAKSLDQPSRDEPDIRAVLAGPYEYNKIWDLHIQLCKDMGIRPPDLYIVRGAKAPTATNTYSYLALSEGLVNMLNEEELRAVLAHELAHGTERNIKIHKFAAFPIVFLATHASLTCLGGLIDKWTSEETKPPSDRRTFFRAMGVLLGIKMGWNSGEIASRVVMQEVSQIDADLSASKYCNPKHLASALRKIEAWEKQNPGVTDIENFLESLAEKIRPVILDRI